MHEQELAIVKSLVSVAWADGKIAAEETELLEALLDTFHATPAEAADVRAFAQVPRTLDDVPLTDLSTDDRRTVLHHAVLLSFVDGQQAPEERELLHRLQQRLRIPEREGQALMADAEARSRQLLHLL